MATARKYWLPLATRAASFVKMRISISGQKPARMVNRPENSRLVRSAIGITFSIEAASCFPQYCAAIIPAPAAMPEIKRLKTNCTCPASETADNEV